MSFTCKFVFFLANQDRYELQIEETWRGKGIGSKLMGILETIAKESGLRFSLLTVCKGTKFSVCDSPLQKTSGQ
jgi:GNAT superfamily N-acetyltransferase